MNQLDLSATSTDLDTLKQEILAEVRQEINKAKLEIIEGQFLQRVSIACYAKRCTSYRKSVCLSVRLSVIVWHSVKTTQARIMGSSLEDSPMTLVSLRLTAARNSKGNLGN